MYPLLGIYQGFLWERMPPEVVHEYLMALWEKAPAELKESPWAKEGAEYFCREVNNYWQTLEIRKYSLYNILVQRKQTLAEGLRQIAQRNIQGRGCPN